MAILGAAALLFFGPDQLPKVARKVGLFMRDVQNTSQTFIREMERAADEGTEVPAYTPYEPASWETAYAPPAPEIDEGPLHAEVTLVGPAAAAPSDEGPLHAEVTLVSEPPSEGGRTT